MFFVFAPPDSHVSFLDRLKIIWSLLTKKQPEISLTPTSKVKFGENKVYFHGDFHLTSSGSLYLSADKHVIIESGQDQEPERPGYRHSVWINSPKDNFGRPLKDEEGSF
jgi:hypothetical protein